MIHCIASIDGTGPVDDTEYTTAMRNDHVLQVINSFPVKNYLRGPDWWDGDGSKDCTTNSMAKTFTWSVAVARHARPTKLWLTGYSRGAGAVLEVAHRLKAQNISIHGLILFDAVDMTNQFDRGTIPSNVQNCVHYTRNQATSGSRESFQPGTIGRRVEIGAGPAVMHTYHCTHGGAGGAFFPASAVSSITGTIYEDMIDGYTNVTQAQDRAASSTIMASARSFIQRLKT